MSLAQEKPQRNVFCYYLPSNIYDAQIGYFITPQNEENSQDLRAFDIDLQTMWLNLLKTLFIQA